MIFFMTKLIYVEYINRLLTSFCLKCAVILVRSVWFFLFINLNKGCSFDILFKNVIILAIHLLWLGFHSVKVSLYFCNLELALLFYKILN